MKEPSPQARLATFLAKYDPAIAAIGKRAVAKLRKLLPGTIELVYDNYNALVVGFGPTDRASDAVMSVALYPRWVSVFFLRGARLKDPERLLKGSGNTVRHIVLGDATDLDRPAVKALVAQAVKLSARPLPGASRRMIIKSVSVRQRPRRPPAKQ